MVGTSQSRLITNLQKIRVKKLCVYISGTFCDCKYGDEDGEPGNGECFSGCPEVAEACALIKAMTPKQFKTLAKRAGIFVMEQEEQEKVVGGKKKSKKSK